MKNFTIFITTTALLMFLTSCGVVKEGFGSPKKDNSDEFLVEKKMPLKMPPKFNELPKPSETNQSNNCLLYTSPSPRDTLLSRMPSSA